MKQNSVFIRRFNKHEYLLIGMTFQEAAIFWNKYLRLSTAYDLSRLLIPPWFEYKTFKILSADNCPKNAIVRFFGPLLSTLTLVSCHVIIN